MTQVKLSVIYPLKYEVMTKRIILSITDADSGEILSQSKPKDVPLEHIKDVLRPWFDSFMRGLEKNRNLYLGISAKEMRIYKQLEIF